MKKAFFGLALLLGFIFCMPVLAELEFNQEFGRVKRRRWNCGLIPAAPSPMTITR